MRFCLFSFPLFATKYPLFMMTQVYCSIGIFSLFFTTDAFKWKCKKYSYVYVPLFSQPMKIEVLYHTLWQNELYIIWSIQFHVWKQILKEMAQELSYDRYKLAGVVRITVPLSTNPNRAIWARWSWTEMFMSNKNRARHLSVHTNESECSLCWYCTIRTI